MPDAGAAQDRRAAVRDLADRIEAVRRPHPTRVAVDGPDAAGKTTLADELAAVLRGRSREVVRASIDGFHRPRADRYRRGESFPLGYYEDSFDYPALSTSLLAPLGPGGDRMYRIAVLDYRTDSPRADPPLTASDDSILLFDGIFLLRPELVGSWDLRIFVATAFDEILRRAVVRDIELFGSADAVEERYRQRYLPAQRLYLESVDPERLADVVFRNDDPGHPVLAPARVA